MWFQRFKLFLFDLDGLLVDTEKLHYQAYKEASKKFGFSMPWDFHDYFATASLSSKALKERFFEEWKEVFSKISWDDFYKEKSRALESFFEKEKIPLMKGAKEVVEELFALNKPLCVVTHSSLQQVEKIKKNHAILQKIPHWFTRESYEKSKPAPDGYLAALKCLKVEPKDSVGFEDSLRGLESLEAAGCSCIMVNNHSEHVHDVCRKKKTPLFSSLDEVLTVDPFGVDNAN
jgi:beta-phosphoglucomutase